MLTGSDLFELLADTNTKFGKACQKEYDAINELCGKHFKRIAKEEGKHDEVLESLEAKLKKANFQYDKQRVKSSGGNSSASMYGAGAGASLAHEQFVPLLSQLTEDITKAKLTHGTSMASKRDAMLREVARSMGNLGELEFRRACDNVRKAGAEIGPVLAAQALLGEKPDKVEPTPMPREWPQYLEQSPVAPQSPQYLGQASLQPPPRMSGERFDSVGSRSGTGSRRSSVAFAPQTEIISRQNSPRNPHQQLASSQPLQKSPKQDQTRLPYETEATVVQRQQQARPAMNTSFPSHSPRDSPNEDSSSLRESHVAKVASVQALNGLQHVISQRGNVGYMDSRRVDRLSEEHSAFADPRYETVRRVLPQGFELDETEMSPDKPLRSMQDVQSSAGTQPSHAEKLEYGEAEKEPATDLHRSASIESSASQQSFVARMKAKYAEEKEGPQASPPGARRSLPLAGSTHSATSSSSSGSGGSGARVSSIAQKYEQNNSGILSPPSSRISSASFTSISKQTGSDAGRPQHKQRASLTVVPGITTSTGHLGQRAIEPAHPSFCACEECSKAGYSQSVGKKAAAQPWSGENGTVRSNRSDRRVSMPVGYVASK